ncbi:hypothetical protein GGR52DRAFT_536867 [Hypoxylon sp. FL1284]|nr:hypothetical protein GGR52DRAFT_536867 [Hypoxylon sp. FL1284]
MWQVANHLLIYNSHRVAFSYKQGHILFLCGPLSAAAHHILITSILFTFQTHCPTINLENDSSFGMSVPGNNMATAGAEDKSGYVPMVILISVTVAAGGLIVGFLLFRILIRFLQQRRLDKQANRDVEAARPKNPGYHMQTRPPSRVNASEFAMFDFNAADHDISANEQLVEPSPAHLRPGPEPVRLSGSSNHNVGDSTATNGRGSESGRSHVEGSKSRQSTNITNPFADEHELEDVDLS